MNKQVSVIVPVYNEQDNVALMYEELSDVAKDNRGLDFEFIFVDDGSNDRTVACLGNAAHGDSRVVILSLRRNFGQTAAMAAGIDRATGEIVVTIDGDLQNDPREIPRLVELLDDGYDLVAGWRKNRQDAALSRKLPSFFANWLISYITKVKLHDYGCTLKAMTAELAKGINLYGELHRFIPALAAEYGAAVKEVPVNHRRRVHGVSKYGISRTFRVILDLLTIKFFLGFSTRPLHMFGSWGFITGGMGAAALCFLSVQKLFFAMPMGSRPMLIIAVMLILLGVQFVCFGLLAEVLVRTYHESQNKKIYVVRKEINCGSSSINSDKIRPLVSSI